VIFCKIPFFSFTKLNCLANVCTDFIASFCSTANIIAHLRRAHHECNISIFASLKESIPFERAF
jgi:hypothetical protein